MLKKLPGPCSAVCLPVVLDKAVQIRSLGLFWLGQAGSIVFLEVFDKQAVLLPGRQAQHRPPMLASNLPFVHAPLCAAEQM